MCPMMRESREKAKENMSGVKWHPIPALGVDSVTRSGREHLEVLMKTWALWCLVGLRRIGRIHPRAVDRN
jgi:hypothetical protein